MSYRTRLKGSVSALALAIGLAFTGFAAAHDGKDHGTTPAPAAASSEAVLPVLFDNLGSLHYPAKTANPEAQRYFDQGLRLAYAFNHAEALRAFRHAQALDPKCAAFYWGEALVLGPNINAPMSPDAVGPALAAIAKGKAIYESTVKEQALLSALAARYSDDPKADRLALDAAYAEAMVKVAERFPDDDEIKVLTAEALMDVQPWDYWEGAAGSQTPKGKTTEIVAMLGDVLKANPDHPGAIHFYLHMMEASDTPQKAEPYADRLAALMPGAGHIVHMPSHIYYRIGRYADSLKLNVVAAKADEEYLEKAKDAGLYAGTYYPHNVHYVLASAQMAGDGKTTVEYAEKLVGLVPDESAATVAWVQPIKAAPYFAHAQYSAPETILAVADPGDTFPYVKAMWHYARGVAFATKGDTESAADAIETIGKTADLSFLISNYVRPTSSSRSPAASCSGGSRRRKATTRLRSPSLRRR
jgi:tetratricopeptide (TPR) repeat protein